MTSRSRAAVAAAALVLAFPALGQPEMEADAGGCTNRTLYGTYVFAGTGFNIVGGVAQPKAILETIFFYGDGNLTVPVATASINGGIVHSAPNGGGSYAVGRDCTGILQFGPPGAAFELVVAPDGREIFMIQSQPNTVLQGRVVRLSP